MQGSTFQQIDGAIHGGFVRCPVNAYCYSDICISSNVGIPFLPLAQDTKQIDVTLRAAPAGPKELEQLSVVEKTREPDALYCRPMHSGYWLQVTTEIGFFINASMNSVSGYWSTSNAHEVVRLFVDHVLPRILARRGRFIVHASCVAFGNRAILFLGDSGRGKSTLALAHCQLAGAELVSDDCVELQFENNKVIAKPTYRAHRVWTDSYGALGRNDYASRIDEGATSKFKLLPPQMSPRRHHVATAMIVGEPAPEVFVEKLSRRASVLALVNQVFQFSESPSRIELDKSFDQCETLFDNVECQALWFPRDYHLLPSVVEITKPALYCGLTGKSA